MKEIKINLQLLYYYLFLSTFGIILFSNLLPSDYISITRLFVFPTALVSLLLINNRLVLIYVGLFISFISIYSLYPVLMSTAYGEHLVKNTRYVFYFIFIFGLVNMFKFIPLERLLSSMSNIFVIKIIFVAIINLNINFGTVFSSYLLNNTGLLIAKLNDSYRILDIYLYFFPLIFIYLGDKNNFIKIVIHTIVIYNLFVSNTYGFIIAYSIIIFLKYDYIKVLFITVTCLFYFYGLNDIIVELVNSKAFSIQVKLNQLLYLMDNLSFFGEGLGVNIEIEGRLDSMLENTIIYWLIVYGIFGFLIIGTYFIFLPFTIYYLFKYDISIRDLFYVHLSVLISTMSNPYIESNVGIMPMLIMVAYYINKRIDIEKFRDRRYLEDS